MFPLLVPGSAVKAPESCRLALIVTEPEVFKSTQSIVKEQYSITDSFLNVWVMKKVF